MKKRKDEERTPSVALGTAIIVIVLILAFGAAFRFMYSLDILFLGDFVEGILGLDSNKDNSPFDVGVLSEVIKSGKDAVKEGAVLDISYETMRASLLTEKDTAGIYLNARINYYSDSTPYAHSITYHRFGEKFRIETFADVNSSAAETLMVSDGKDIVFTDFAAQKTVTYKKAEDISAENEAGIPTVEELLSALEKFPESADTAADNFILKEVNTEQGNVFYVAFTNAETGFIEEYYIVPEFRIIISSVTRTADGEIIYSYEVTDFSVDKKDYYDYTLYKTT